MGKRHEVNGLSSETLARLPTGPENGLQRQMSSQELPGANGNTRGVPVMADSFKMPPSAMAGTKKGPKAKSKTGFSNAGSRKSGGSRGSRRSGDSSETANSFTPFERPFRVKRRNSADSAMIDGSKAKSGTLDTLSNVFGVTYTRFEPREDS